MVILKARINNSGLLFALGYLIYSMVYVCRLNLSVAAPVLQQLGVMTKTQFGWFGSVFFVTYSFGRLFNGYLGDKIKTRIMIAVALTGIGVTNLLIGLMPPLPALLIFWGLNGYAQSMIWGPLLRLVSSRYTEKKRSLMASFLASSIAAGSIAGILAATCITGIWGVKFAFILPGTMTLFVGVVVILFLPDDGTALAGEVKNEKTAGARIHLRPRDVGLVLLPAFLHGIIKDNLNTWAPSYFVDEFDIDLNGMALFVFVIPLLGFMGRLFYPVVFKLCGGREHIASIVGFSICLLALLPLCLSKPGPILAAICLSLIAAAIQLINTSMLSIVPLRFAEKGAVSTVSGMMDFATYMGAGVSSSIYGYLLDRIGYGAMYGSWIVIAGISILLLTFCQKKSRRGAA